VNRQTLNLTANVIASDTQELYDIAKSKGINLPHPALGIFKSVLCEISKPNANGIRLAPKATDVAVSTLIGTQINKNHLRTDNVLGHTIDAVINKNKEVEVVCIFFKDLYSEDWEEAQELFSKNNLTVSFELSADIESQEKLADGTKILNDFYFTGLALLFGVKPACKRARVFEMATKKLQDKLTIERQSLIFANNQNTQKSIMEVLKLMADEVKKIEEVQVAEVVAEVPVEVAKVEESQKLCPECQEPMEDDKCAKCGEPKQATEEPITPIEEAKVEEPIVAQPEVMAQPEVVEEAPSTVVREETVKETRTIDPIAETETVKVEVTTVVTVDDEKKMEQTQVIETVYSQTQLDEVKAGYEAQIAELKEQISNKDVQIENIKLTAEKLVTRKIELKDNEACQGFTDEDYLNDAKVEEAVCKKTKSKKLAELKEELKSNEFAKDFSDEDYFNADKVENAKLKNQLASKKISEDVIASQSILSTGHKKLDASDSNMNPLVRVLRNKKNK
jgi:hypothetical protein